MNRRLTLSLIAIAAIGVVVFYAVMPREGARPNTADASGVVSSDPNGNAAATPATAPAAATVGGNGESREARADAARTAALLRIARATGRFLDEAGAPIEGVRVVRARRDPPSWGGDAHIVPELGGPEVTSNAAGVFVWSETSASDADPEPRTLTANRLGHRRTSIFASLRRGETLALGDLVLGPGGDLDGVVVDASGNPASGAGVSLMPGGLDAAADAEARRFGPREQAVRYVTSGADGAFAFAGAPVGTWRVWAERGGNERGSSDDVRVEAASNIHGVRVALEPMGAESSIDGIVLRPDGSPLPQAVIEVRSSGGGFSQFTAGDDGRFKSPAFTDGTWTFEAKDREGRFETARAREIRAGTRDLVLRLGEPRKFTIEVRSSEGGPVETFRVELKDPALPPFTGTIAWSAFPGGRADVIALPAPFFVDVDAPGHAPAHVGPIDPNVLPEVLPIVLRRLPGIAGRVVFLGKPVEGAVVQLAAFLGLSTSGGFPCRSLLVNDVNSVRTDANGSFQLSCSRSIRFAFVRAESAGFAAAEIGPFPYTIEAGRQGLELKLTEGGALEVHVRVAEGRDPAGIEVGVSRGDGEVRVAKSSADGTCRFERLTPGNYDVRSLDKTTDRGTRQFAGEPDEIPDIPVVCTVQVGETTRFELDLRNTRKRVVGVVRLGFFVPVGAKVTVTPVRSSGNETASVAGEVDAEGRFVLEVPRAGSVAVIVAGSTPDGRTFSIRDELELASIGDTAWRFEPKTGSVAGTCPISDGAEKPVLAYRSGRIMPFVTGIVPVGPDGKFSMENMPAGALHFRRFAGSKEMGSKQIDVPAGDIVTVDVP